MKKARTRIVFPHNRESVNLRGDVLGFVWPTDSPVELLVFSRDKKWYYQAKPDRMTGRFQVNVQFGDDTAPSGTEYQLAVIVKKVTKKPPQTELPETVASDIVTVVRS